MRLFEKPLQFSGSWYHGRCVSERALRGNMRTVRCLLEGQKMLFKDTRTWSNRRAWGGDVTGQRHGKASINHGRSM